MRGDWMRDLARMVESKARLVGRAGLDGSEVTGKNDIAELLVHSKVASAALEMSEAEIESAVPEKDAWYETRAMLIQEAARSWRVDWRAAKHALDSLLAIDHAFLRFCTDTSAHEHLAKAAEILDELRSIASDGWKNDPSGSVIAAILRGI